MRIHIISNSLRLNSGFGIVARYIALGLIKLGHVVNMTGMQTISIPEYTFGIEQLPLVETPLNEEMQLAQNMIASNPDVVLCIFQGDKDFNYMTRTFSRTVGYFPVEGKNIPKGMANDLKYIMQNNGMVVAQCNYGLSEMKKVGVEGKVIYHGFNPFIFRPLDLRSKDKDKTSYCYLQTEVGKINTDPVLLHKLGCYDSNKLGCYDSNNESSDKTGVGNKCVCHECRFKREEIVRIEKWVDFGDGKGSGWAYRDIKISDLIKETQGRFVYLGVGQNLGVRKRWERLLKAYAMLIIGEDGSRQMKDRTVLWLHTNPVVTNPEIYGIDMHSIIQELGIQDNVIFSYGRYISSGLSEEAISVLHNLADVYVSASSSEGYGIGTLYSMACGVPVVAPACSSFIELVGMTDNKDNVRGLLADIGEWQMIENHSFRALVDEHDLMIKMKKMYDDDELRAKYGRNASEWAKQYSWDKICSSWDKLLKEMVDKDKEKNVILKP